MSKLRHPDLVVQTMATIDKILNKEKGRLLEMDGVKLHPSEIHLLLFLNARSRANATDIAQHFSVTKGAVSQTLSRLERKGVLVKGRNPESLTELNIELTEVGVRLMAQAVRLKKQAEEHYDRLFSALDGPGREAVRKFLEGIQVRFHTEE